MGDHGPMEPTPTADPIPFARQTIHDNDILFRLFGDYAFRWTILVWILAFIVANFWNFQLNRSWTFKRDVQRSYWKEFWPFFADYGKTSWMVPGTHSVTPYSCTLYTVSNTPHYFTHIPGELVYFLTLAYQVVYGNNKCSNSQSHTSDDQRTFCKS